jgi:hypothetical protein
MCSSLTIFGSYVKNPSRKFTGSQKQSTLRKKSLLRESKREMATDMDFFPVPRYAHALVITRSFPMNASFSLVDESQAVAEYAEQSSLTFVEDAEYEFVGGGAISTNGF